MSQNFKVKTLSIQTADKLVDISRGFVSLDYYEDITSPTVIFDVVVIDGDGAIADLPILGGEYFNLKVEATYEDLETISFTVDDNNPLCIVNMRILPDNNVNLYSFRLVSVEILANETTRVVNRYDASISSSVENILTDNDLIGTQKELFVESTNNSYSFIGCYKRPFDIINWLCPKSVPSTLSSGGSDESGSAGFLFYENRKGYCFKSIDKTFEDATNPVTLVQSQIPVPNSSSDYYKTFSDINVTEGNDVLKTLRMGGYAHNSIFLNMKTMKYDVIISKLSTKYNDGGLTPSYESSETPTLNGLEDYPSRLMYRLLDPGVMDKDGNVVPDEQLAKYQANSYMRYNLLFTTTTKITLPYNITLCAGDVVKLQIAKAQKGNPQSKVDQSLVDQRYMISKIRHTIQGDNNFSSLELVSDSYSISNT